MFSIATAEIVNNRVVVNANNIFLFKGLIFFFALSLVIVQNCADKKPSAKLKMVIKNLYPYDYDYSI